MVNKCGNIKPFESAASRPRASSTDILQSLEKRWDADLEGKDINLEYEAFLRVGGIQQPDQSRRGSLAPPGIQKPDKLTLS
eukprot:1127015-Amorphochlora_amoeboformis.AAC.1